MRHSKLVLLLAMLFSMIGTKATAEIISVKNADGIEIFYNFINDGKELEVTRSSETYTGNIVIPATVNYSGSEFKVTAIGDGAFGNCMELTSVTIPESVTAIESDAFGRCTSLSSINIPNSVTTIGDRAFSDCTGLTSINIPNSVTSIGAEAFYNCSGIVSITIPESVTSIGEEAFYGCSSLTAINVDEANNYYSSIDGVLFTKDKTQILLFPQGKSGEFSIPYGVTSIKSGVFISCSGLTSVTIPESVTEIGWYSFQDCIGLTSITIPKSVAKIESLAFIGCSSLTAINVDEANSQYTSIDGVLIEKARGFNGEWYIACCPEGKSGDYSVPTGLSNILPSAFRGCSRLTSITFPGYLEYVGLYAFDGCSSLKSINVKDGRYYTSIDGVLFIYTGGEGKLSLSLVRCPGGKTGEYSIPEDVETIRDGAFSGCSGLTSVIIPQKVENIVSLNYYSGAFSGCTGLKSITNLATTPQKIQDYTFSNYDCDLHVLPECVEAYEQADVWKKFNIIGDANAPAGIDGVTMPTGKVNGAWYTLDGVRTDNPAKGKVYIHDGKKVMRK